MPAAAILDIFRSQICNGPNGHEGQTSSPCQISLKSLKLLPRYGDFSIFLSVDFWNYKVGRIISVELRHHVKFRGDCSNRCHDISIFFIFQDSGSHNLGFLKFYILMIRTVKKDGLRHCAKFCQNRSNHGGDMSIFDFSRWRPSPSWIFEISNFNGRNSQEGRTASSCQISWKSLQKYTVN